MNSIEGILCDPWPRQPFLTISTARCLASLCCHEGNRADDENDCDEGLGMNPVAPRNEKRLAVRLLTQLDPRTIRAHGLAAPAGNGNKTAETWSAHLVSWLFCLTPHLAHELAAGWFCAYS